MFCPKCKEVFEEGSRRFCPTDGSRLASEVDAKPPAGGIFANLIPQMDGMRDLDTTLANEPRPVFETLVEDEPEPVAATEPALDEDIFFEFEDEPKAGSAAPEPVAPEPVFAPPPIPEFIGAPKPAARKVNPYHIPAGHVDLDDESRAGYAVDFDADDPEAFVGRIVKGRYKVTQVSDDEGEASLAFLAEDKLSDDKKVLVRILIDDEEDEMLDSILAEERIALSHFSHPNVARLVDSGEFTGGIQFLISEYIDALSVRDVLDIHGQFGATRAARVVRQAAEALGQAHQEGILHRDIRPENLILDTDDFESERTMIVDFGASNGEPTPVNVAYKAPEQLDGRSATAASDIFSLAATAYEMLTTRLPFEGDTPRELLRSQADGFQAEDLPPAVAAVLGKAMAFAPSERYVKAREFGDAFYEAVAVSPAGPSVEAAVPAAPAPAVAPEIPAAVPEAPTTAAPAARPAQVRQAPAPQANPAGTKWMIGILGAGLLVLFIGAGLYWFGGRAGTGQPTSGVNVSQEPGQSPIAAGELPPARRNIQQPPNSEVYLNKKEGLRGDLLANFIGFSLYYPKDWKVNGPQPGATAGSRGKFIDISRTDAEGRMTEQMLVSYYPSKGTFADDAARFPQLVAQTNTTLRKLLPGYQIVSQGEVKFNGDWRAYEVKFQAGGTSASGGKLIVWGRRLFVPTARPGVRNGFEITMLATSYASEVRSVDDVGVRGELAPILTSFEPGQNF